jgi:hypothetical protein
MTDISWETGREKGERLKAQYASRFAPPAINAAETGAAMLLDMDKAVDALVDVLYVISVGRLTVGEMRRLASRRIAGFPEAVKKAGKRTTASGVGF